MYCIIYERCLFYALLDYHDKYANVESLENSSV